MVTGRPHRTRRFKRKIPLAIKVFRPNFRSLRNQDKSHFIVNLSGRPLKDSHSKVLERGLNYCVATPHSPEFDTGVNRLSRQLRLDYFFGNDPDDPLPPPNPFRRTSAWQPPRASPPIESYIASLPNRLSQIELKPFIPNLTRVERTAVNQLERDHSLVVRGADKGAVVVVEDRQQYIRDGLSHLSDRDIYAPVLEDPTNSLAQAINIYVRQVARKGYISEEMRHFLIFPEPTRVRTQQMYFLKKLHKGLHAVRPIVSGSSGPTEKLSKFIDLWLKPLVKLIPSYVRDSSHFILRMQDKILPQDVLLVTIDVTALYPSIPHTEGIAANIKALYREEESSPPFPQSVAREILTIILTRNYFEFDGRMYRQTRGTAMGTHMAPSYANLFLAELEASFLPEFQEYVLVWFRFIDDVFMVWRGDSQSLNLFLESINTVHSSVKFTWTISSEGVDFLDLHVYKGPGFRTSGAVDFCPHYKQTNAFQYVHYCSSHPRSMFRGVVKGELIRILRASSDPQTFSLHSLFILSKFRLRGYPPPVLDHVLSKVSFADRQTALTGSTDTPKRRPPFISVYSNRIPKEQLHRALEPPPGLSQPLMCFRRPRSLRDRVVRARLKGSIPPTKSVTPITIHMAPSFEQHSTGCNSPRCDCCVLMSGRAVVFGGCRHFKMPFNTCCGSVGLVYLIECSLCGIKARYVGQTSRELRVRMSGHRRDFRNDKGMPLYRHLKRPSHTFYSINLTVLELVRPPSEANLLAREQWWMDALKTRIPHGLNSQF